ncbi:LVIVD repeat-containing protein [Sporichthya polymorpha]|uniref:LVIVD repeat-containing protein n=1 Tax=Sporichthya polymorpha TaxID=35751 RepID=UPI00036FFD99|nr:hypothetical protein [Sporichthya polymorpha]
MKALTVVPLACALALAPLAVATGYPASADSTAIADSAVPRATCGPGSSPETGLQGQVPLRDRQSGRSQQGYWCNLELLGQHQGEGTTWVNPQYKHCAYNATAFAGIPTKKSQGVQVIDVGNPRKPRLTANLTSPAMLAGTWETLKVNEERGLLAGVSVGPVVGALSFDVYDISTDCTRPKLLNSFSSADFTLPASTINHEGQWSPDGRTYWSSSLAGGGLTAIDVSDPTKPRIAGVGTVGVANHGFELSEDGNRLYLSTAFGAGVIILDVSEVQARNPVPVIRQLGSVFWGGPASVGQHTIPVTWSGKPYLIAVDEFAGEGVHIIDISDETRPRIVRQLQLEIQQPQNAAVSAEDTKGNGLFGYDAHYCTVDRRTDPTALACGMMQSGVRVFDVRNPLTPREIAYYNPPAQVGRNADLSGSEHATYNFISQSSNVSDIRDAGPSVLLGASPYANLTADWCSSPPRFVGKDQLWVSCQDNGFLALKFTNKAYRRP